MGDVGAPGHLFGPGPVYPLWQVLAGQGEQAGGLAAGKGHEEGPQGLLAVGRADDQEVGDGTEPREVLHRLVARPVLP